MSDKVPEPATPQIPKARRSWSVPLDTVARAALLLGGALYALGFVVVAIHQARYGVLVTGLLRTQYVLAGVWWTVPLAVFGTALSVIAFYVVVLHKAMETVEWKEMTRWKQIRTLVAFPVFLVLIVAGAWYALTAGVGEGARMLGFTSAGWKGALGAMAVSVLPLFWLFFPIRRWMRKWSKERAGGIRALLVMQLHDIFSDAWLLFSMLVLYTVLFTVRAYPQIPAQFGGGAPREVRFLLRQGWDAPFLEADSTGTLSYPYRVLLETERTYLVQSLSRPEEVIEFSRDKVAGTMTYRPSPANGRPNSPMRPTVGGTTPAVVTPGVPTDTSETASRGSLDSAHAPGLPSPRGDSSRSVTP